MPKYRLLKDHFIDDRLIVAGTEIGDGTPYPFNAEPSQDMVGVDDASQKLIEKRFAALTSEGAIPSYGEDGPGPKLEQVGEKPLPPAAANPLLPVGPLVTAPTQPLPPYPVEQVFGSGVTRPDPSLSPEERQAVADGASDVKGSQEPAGKPVPDPAPPKATPPTASGKLPDGEKSSDKK